MEENIEFSLIASPLETEPSPMDHIDALGVDSARFVTLTSLRSYALANLPFNK